MNKIAVGLVFFLLLISCDSKNCGDHRKFVIMDFSKKRVDTLVPYENETYVGYFIKIKGNINDTVKIYREDYGYYYILPKKVDTLLNGDYYGTENIIWTFEPYKATKGKLDIEYGL